MINKNILISGAGIAGTTLAFWLKKFGFNPSIVEHAPKLREGGYAIDFWGLGFDVADRMDIVAELAKTDLHISELTLVDKNNKRKGGLNYLQLKKLMNNRAFTLLRSDLSKIIYNKLDKDIEIFFGDTITKIEQLETQLRVTFQGRNIRDYDLVVGADGLHSNVRSLVFGNEALYEKYYGYYTSSFSIDDRGNNSKAFEMYNVPGKQAAVYSNGQSKSIAFFIFTSPQKLSFGHADIGAQKQILRREFCSVGWKCPDLLSKMDAASDFYFDTVSQIQMNDWSQGRITLVGDACDCPSLLSGQGSTLAMVAAYVLAGELKESNGNYEIAFQRYHDIFKHFVDDKQKIAQDFAKSFVPKTRFGIWTRNILVKLMFLPLLSKLFVKQFTDHRLKLKEY